MKKMKMTPLKGIALLLLLVTSLGVMAGCNKNDGILEVPPEEEYSYINPDETKAETDAGFVIDGILDGTRLTMARVAKNLFRAGFTLTEIFKMTSRNPSAALGLSDRGAIRENMRADLILIDENANFMKVL